MDRGRTWTSGGKLSASPDLTDAVKGRRQYWLRLNAGVKQLAGSGLTITTICQANGAVMPRLKDRGSVVRFEASGRAVVSAGPNVPQAQPQVVAGGLGSPTVTLALTTPRGEPVTEVYAAAHVRSGSPPDPNMRYQIDVSSDRGTTWRPVVKDWKINRQGDEPADFWSQSFCWGNTEMPSDRPVSAVWVRFRNDGGKAYARAEVHLAYRVKSDPTRVTFAWTDDAGEHTSSHEFAAVRAASLWTIPTGRAVHTRWVEFAPAPLPSRSLRPD